VNSCIRQYQRWRLRTFFICQNHSFLDGNKRTGANAAITFLLLNGWEPQFGSDELVEIVLSVASGTMKKEELTRLFVNGCQPPSPAG